MYTSTQKLAAEFLGTFALVFFGAGAICADQFLHGGGGVGLIGVALAHGLALAIMISELASLDVGRISPNFTEFFDRYGLSIKTVSSMALLPPKS